MPPFEYDPLELFREMVRLSNELDMSWRYTKKGDRRPLADIEAQKAGRRKVIKAKQEAATERTLAAIKPGRNTRRPPGEDIQSRMLKAMEPGSWYGRGDLMRMIGEIRTSRGKVNVMLQRGWLQSARNPAYSGSNPAPWEIMAGAEPHPERLYRLTEAGMVRRAELLIDKGDE